MLHLSDPHLLAGGRELYGRVDSESHLRQVFEQLEASGGRPEAIILTGDLADKGEPEAYDLLRSIVEPAAARLGAQVIWVMGNHDDRASFHDRLLGEMPSYRPVNRSYDIDGLRIISLDTTVPGKHYGTVTPDSLDWLAEELSVSAPEGTILAMHHPPLPTVLDLAVSVELRDQADLREVVEGSDIRAILAGHLHYSSTGMFAGVPVSVASAVCYTQDLTVPVGGTRPHDGARAFNLVHVYEDTVLHSVVPVGEHAVLDYVDPAETKRRLAADGILIPQARPRKVHAPASISDPPMTMPIPVHA